MQWGLLSSGSFAPWHWEALKPSAHSDPQRCTEAVLAQQIWTLIAPILSNLTSEHLYLGDLNKLLKQVFSWKKSGAGSAQQ